MKASVVVSSHNRSAILKLCAEAILAQDFAEPWELILVDNASTDDTRAVCEVLAARSPVPLRYVFEPKRGASAARNAGLRLARGEFIAITDSDCLVSEGWLATIAALFEEHREAEFLSGLVLLGSPELQNVSVNLDPKPRTLENRADYDFVWGANMALRTSLLARFGYFDERMGPGSRFSSSEENDLAYRWLKAGVRGRYSPEISVRHHHGRTSRKEAEDVQYHYGRGEAAMFAKWVWRGDFYILKAIYWTIGYWTRLAFAGSPAHVRANARARLTGFWTCLVPALIGMRGRAETSPEPSR